jgi:hypothetical protein
MMNIENFQSLLHDQLSLRFRNFYDKFLLILFYGQTFACLSAHGIEFNFELFREIDFLKT